MHSNFLLMSGRVLSSESVEGGEGWGQSGRGGIAGWGGAGDSEDGQLSSVSAVGDNGGKACFLGQDGGGGGKETVCRPSLDSMPETIHAPER